MTATASSTPGARVTKRRLGWDMTNENGYAEAYKDVIHEDAVKAVDIFGDDTMTIVEVSF